MDLECFLFLAGKCKNPEEVFPRGSTELKLAQAWLGKLGRLACDNWSERTLRIRYLGQFCACLNNQKLKGPFLSAPSLDFKLDPNVNFDEDGSPAFDCSPESAIDQESD